MTEKINLLVVDDEGPLRDLLVERFSRQEFSVIGCASGEEALAAAIKQEFDVAIIDIRMPGMSGIDLFRAMRKTQPQIEAVALTGQATIDNAIEAMKLGFYDFIAKPAKLYELEIIIRKAYEKKMLAMENMRLKSRIGLQGVNYEIVGKSEKARELRALVAKIAKSPTPVLITGEAGTGKEYAARAIHQAGMPKDAPFIPVNCGAIPHGILETQLFGYEEGAYTGAVGKKEGWLDMAAGGTIFLEEIEELHPATQVKLHRFLESGFFQRVGGNVDVGGTARIIASTQADMRELTLKKTFREELYYRLGVVTIQMPPLRERKEDIPELIAAFLMGTGSNNKKFSVKAVNAMLKYDWPGNLRELHNVVERTVLLASKNTIQAKDVPLSLDKKSKGGKLRHLMSLSEVEKEHILFVLGACGGNISRASRILGVSRPKLYRKIGQYKTGGKKS